MRKKLSNQKQQQVDDEDDRIAKAVAERESKREVNLHIAFLRYASQFFHHFLIARTRSQTNPPLALAIEFAQASICKAHLLRADTPTISLHLLCDCLIVVKMLGWGVCLSRQLCFNRSQTSWSIILKSKGRYPVLFRTKGWAKWDSLWSKQSDKYSTKWVMAGQFIRSLEENNFINVSGSLFP